MQKTKAQISFVVIVKLICVFVFATSSVLVSDLFGNIECWFSHVAAQISQIKL